MHPRPKFLIEKTDRCTDLARARNDLMAKAVELDTTRQKVKKKEDSSGA